MAGVTVLQGRPDPQDRVLEIVGGPLDGCRMAVRPGVQFRDELLIPIQRATAPSWLRGPFDEESETSRMAVGRAYFVGVRAGDGVVVYRWAGVREG